MKKGYKYLSLFAVLILTGLAACNKYGYNFADGYEGGQEKANMPGGQSDSMGINLSKIYAARNFPGLVGDAEPRLNNVNVTVDFSERYVPASDIRISSAPQPWYSTGLYAPTGEPVTIEVPQGVNGIVAVIGGWTDNLDGVPATKRDPVIFNQLALQPGKNVIRNLYGGMLYLRTNGTVKELGTLSVKVSGAVKSPDFILGVSNDADWKAQVKNSSVPWFQLRGKRIIFELPKLFLDKHPIESPTALMEEWDRIIEEDIYKWKGLEDHSIDSLNRMPNHPIRVIMDAQPRLAYAHNAFPVVVQMDENLFTNEIANYENLITKGAWRTISEIGRNNSTYFWLFSTLNATAGNLFSAKMANRRGFSIANLHPGMRLAVDTGLLYTRQNKLFTSNFSKDVTARTNGDLIKLLPFIQLFEYYGYGMMGYIEYNARHYNLGGLSEQQKMNYFFTLASEYAQTDLSAFFRAWAIPVSTNIKDSIEKRFPYLTKTIFDYNPITKTGIRDSAMPKPRELERAGWSVIGFCCQESTTGPLYASKLIDGDINTLWQTRENHTPHTVTFDLGSIADIGGFYYVNGPSTLRPKNIKVYVSWDNATWVEAYSSTGWDVGGATINKADFASNKRYIGARYVRFEVKEPFVTSATNTISTAEFGVLSGLPTQTPTYPPPPPEDGSGEGQ
ncbi:M60 family metallopeptidase [Niabella beijingensis]|uniref:M60 family metallopeptidase n=1 Tax=Niabella beijingensis TaxID=2872700 RepID=UPI001CBEC4CA|nr:M60 family metallopeptidase [Niabella beijingensis]MBZ4191045.1 M60 family metallopeptidase [Niabella beijingensis]